MQKTLLRLRELWGSPARMASNATIPQGCSELSHRSESPKKVPPKGPPILVTSGRSRSVETNAAPRPTTKRINALHGCLKTREPPKATNGLCAVAFPAKPPPKQTGKGGFPNLEDATRRNGTSKRASGPLPSHQSSGLAGSPTSSSRCEKAGLPSDLST